MPKEVRAERLRWTDIQSYLEHDDRVLIAIGAVEQHGAHLAMGTDTMIADTVAHETAKRAGVIIYPPVWYGWSDAHMAFAGTVTLRASTLQAIMVDVVESLTTAGFRRFLFVNGNRRANLPPMQVAASELSIKPGRLVAVADVGYLATEEVSTLRHSSPGGIGHAGEIETAMMQHMHPKCVWMDEAVANPSGHAAPGRAFMPSDPAHEGGDRFFLPRTPSTFWDATNGTGVSGDPTLATPETGKAVLEAMTAGLLRVLENLRQTPLPESR